MGKYISCQWTRQESRSSNTHIRQSRLWNESHKERESRKLFNGSGSLQEEYIIIINIYVSNIGAPRYIKQILIDIKWEIDGNTIIVGEFNSPHISMDRFSTEKINKATEILKDTIETLG